MTKDRTPEKKRRPGPEPEVLKLDEAMEDVAKKMLATPSSDDWERDLAKLAELGDLDDKDDDEKGEDD